MAALPESVPLGPSIAAVALVVAGFAAIIFSGTIGIIVGTLLLLVGGGIGVTLGYTLWKATE